MCERVQLPSMVFVNLCIWVRGRPKYLKTIPEVHERAQSHTHTGQLYPTRLFLICTKKHAHDNITRQVNTHNSSFSQKCMHATKAHNNWTHTLPDLHKTRAHNIRRHAAKEHKRNKSTHTHTHTHTSRDTHLLICTTVHTRDKSAQQLNAHKQRHALPHLHAVLVYHAFVHSPFWERVGAHNMVGLSAGRNGC